MTKRESSAVTRIAIGDHPGQAVSIFAWTALEIGIPTVEIAGDIDGLCYMKPETAEDIARGLLRAAQLARGEQAPPQRGVSRQ